MDPRNDDAGLLAADAMQQLGFAIINVLGALILLVPVVVSIFAVADVLRARTREQAARADTEPVGTPADESAA